MCGVTVRNTRGHREEMHSRLGVLKRGGSDEDVSRAETHGGASKLWNGRGTGSGANAREVAVDINDGDSTGTTLGSLHFNDELSSGGDSDDSNGTVVTHHNNEKDVKQRRDGAIRDGYVSVDVEASGVVYGTNERSFISQAGGSVGSIVTTSQSLVAGLMTPPNLPGLFTGTSPLKRVDSQTHVKRAIQSVPGLHKRGIDLPMTRRLAFRKCRSFARNKALIVLLCVLAFVAVVSRRNGAHSVDAQSIASSSSNRSTRHPGIDASFRPHNLVPGFGRGGTVGRGGHEHTGGGGLREKGNGEGG